jgi:hypothetical protein
MVTLTTAAEFVSQQVLATMERSLGGRQRDIQEYDQRHLDFRRRLQPGVRGPLGQHDVGHKRGGVVRPVAPGESVTFSFSVTAPTPWAPIIPVADEFAVERSLRSDFSRHGGSGGWSAGPPNFQACGGTLPAGSEAGWGINFAHQADTIFATWFTYDLTGKGMWLTMTATKDGSQHL